MEGMNPTVLIAMWGRKKLVEANINLLSQENCSIAIVASLQEDFDFIRRLKRHNVQLIPAPNHPLGRKWQLGVDACRFAGADPLIILGSDDFLSKGFIKKACELSRVYDFIYFDKWYILDTNGGKAYSMDYRMVEFLKPPIGGGRIYSRKYLERMLILFDTGLDSLLDDYAWYERPSDCKELMNPKDMHILSLKGDWEMKNPIEKFMDNERIGCKQINDLDYVFGFDTKKSFKNI